MSTDLLDPSSVDERGVRDDRHERLLAAMADHDLNVLVLGRPAEVAFATGARQLWTAGSRPFGPACVVVRSTGHAHLLSVSDRDVPDEVGHDDLYGLSWNPANLTSSLAAIPGLRDARRVGTTSSSPGFGRLVAAIAPGAAVVDGATAMWAARLPKSAPEVARIVAATEIAEIGLLAMERLLRVGASERDLRAAHLEAIAAAGAPTAPTEGVACATASAGPVTLRRVDRTTPIEPGRLVVLDAGAFHRGYEGGIGRTRVAGDVATTPAQEALAVRARAALDAVVDACRPGATGADLVAAWRSTGEALPPAPLAHGIGLGVEPPVIGADVGHRSVLAPRTVLAVTAWVAEEGVGGVLERDLVLVDDHGPIVLTARIPAGLGRT